MGLNRSYMEKFKSQKITSLKPFFYSLLEMSGIADPEINWRILQSPNFTLSDDIINGKNTIELVQDTDVSNFNGNSVYTHFKGDMLITYQETTNECLSCFIERISNYSVCDKIKFCYKGVDYLIFGAKLSNLIPIAERDGITLYRGKYNLKISKIRKE